MDLVDLKLPKKTKSELKKDMAVCQPGQETYPYWSRFSISTEQMSKFPKLRDAKIGERVAMKGMGEVVEVRKVDRQDKKNDFTVEVQIQKIAIEPTRSNPMKGSLTEAIGKSKAGKLRG